MYTLTSAEVSSVLYENPYESVPTPGKLKNSLKQGVVAIILFFDS